MPARGGERGCDTPVIGGKTKAGAGSTKYKLNSQTQDTKTGSNCKQRAGGEAQGSGAARSCPAELWEPKEGWYFGQQEPSTGQKAQHPPPHTHTARSDLALIAYKQFIKV